MSAFGSLSSFRGNAQSSSKLVNVDESSSVVGGVSSVTSDGSITVSPTTGAVVASLPPIFTAGTYGSASEIPVVTYDNRGRAVGTPTVVPPALPTSVVVNNGPPLRAGTNMTVTFAIERGFILQTNPRTVILAYDIGFSCPAPGVGSVQFPAGTFQTYVTTLGNTTGPFAIAQNSGSNATRSAVCNFDPDGSMLFTSNGTDTGFYNLATIYRYAQLP